MLVLFGRDPLDGADCTVAVEIVVGPTAVERVEDKVCEPMSM